ncbi:MAG TPA: TetR/AcrR family transcriptional regulator [Mycobacteriales bacterium]|jgi:AcrR family transcriptional regulator
MYRTEREGPPDGIRRPPYGANPALGRHGTRARREILDVARRLFGERGYHGTSVEAIGAASGRSGAAVYQYFEGKGDLFRVLVAELADEVLAEARALGSMPWVEAGHAGLDELQARIRRLSAVVDRHATTLLAWPFAEASEPVLDGSSVRFLNEYRAAVRPVLVRAGVPEDQVGPLALAIGSLVHSAHCTLAERTPDMDPARVDAVVARVVYLALFPRDSLGPDAEVAGERPEPPRPPRPAGSRPGPDPAVEPGVRRRITARSRPTLERIAAAATIAFCRNGYRGTTLNDVAAEAGVSHGSVYTYWPDRGSLFSTLAHRAAVALSDHIEAARPGFASPEEGRAWLSGWLDVMCTHGAVFHVWTHEVVGDERLGPLAREMTAYVSSFFSALLRSAPAAGSLDELPAYLVQWSLLTDLPYTLSVQLGGMSRAELTGALERLVLRGLLGYP